MADRQPLLGAASPKAASGSGSYGSINLAEEEEEEEELENNCRSVSRRPPEDNEQPDDDGPPSDQSSASKSDGCCSALQTRDAYHHRLLLFDVFIIVLGIMTSGLLVIELTEAYGQCIVGMDLYIGGLLVRGVKRFWCRCPLYTVMLTSTVPWIAIMINWVSDLYTKKCAFGKWLKWQAILVCFGAFGAICSTGISAVGFGVWCNRVTNFMNSPQCYRAAQEFDFQHSDQFVKLHITFIYTFFVMILQIFLLLSWVGSCYYAVRLWMKEPKMTFFSPMLLPHNGRYGRQSDETDDQPDNIFSQGSIITEQMTTIPSQANT